MKIYKNLSEALKDMPKTEEEFVKSVHLENSSKSKKKKEEQQERINKYEICFVNIPKKSKKDN